MTTPSSTNLYVGAGEVWFNRFDTAGLKTNWRHLGNVSKLELSPNAKTLEKHSAMTGARALISSSIIETGAELKMLLDEFDANNVAIALLGAVAAHTQTVGTATDAALVGTAKKGQALSTGFLKVTAVTSVKVAAVVGVAGTDYSVDLDSGLITLLAGATAAGFVDGATMTWSGSYPALTSNNLITALSNAKIKGSLRYRSAADQIGPRYVVDVWSIILSPDAPISLLGTVFGELGLAGKILQDTTQASGNQFFQVLEL